MKHILIIDDDIHISNMLKELLTKEGYAVSRAYSGTEAALAVSHIKQGSTRPDLVLLDLMLPGLDGEDVLPLLKGIPVIVVSAKADCDHKAELLFGEQISVACPHCHSSKHKQPCCRRYCQNTRLRKYFLIYGYPHGSAE